MLFWRVDQGCAAKLLETADADASFGKVLGNLPLRQTSN
jgi:hypothetical protein